MIDGDALSYESDQNMLRWTKMPSTPAVSEPDALRSLLARAQQGDREAARSLLSAVAPAVHAVVRRALGPSHPDLDDLAQESLVGFMRALDGFRGECSVLHFARRISLFRVIEEQKRNRAQKRGTDRRSYCDPDAAPTEARTHADTVDAQHRELLNELLAGLRPEQAEAFAMRHLLDYSVEEIAEAANVPANTIRSRLRLAKEALRARIEAEPVFSMLAVREA